MSAESALGRLPNPSVVLPVALVVAIDPAGWLPFTTLRWAVVTVLVFASVAGCWRELRIDRRTGLLWAALSGWAAVAAATGIDSLHAWIGTPQRHLGWLAWLLFGCAFVVGQQLGRQRSKFAWSCSIASVLLGLGAVAEKVGWWFFDIEFAEGRVGAWFGNPAMLGAAAVFFLFVCAGIAADHDAADSLRWVAAFGAAGAFATLLLSQSRAALLAFVLASVVGLWSTRDSMLPAIRRRAAPAAAVVVMLAAAFLLSGLSSRVADSFGTGGGIESRFDEWKVGIKTAAANPLGVGPEGYRIAFMEHVTDDYEQKYGRAVLPDRAHSAPIDIAVTLGLPGLALWAALLVAIGRRLVVVLRAGSPALVGMAVGSIAYFLNQLWLFPLADIDLVVWLTLGLLVATAPNQDVVQGGASVRLVIGGTAAIAAITAAVFGFLDISASRNAQAAIESDDPAEALVFVTEVVESRSDQFIYPLLQSRLTLDAGELDLALAASRAALDLSPRDPILLQRNAEVLSAVAAQTSDTAAKQAAMSAWFNLTEIDPTNSQWWFGYGLEVVDVNPNEARTAWGRSAELSPADPAPFINIAILELDAGNLEAARAAIDEALERAPDDQQAQEIRDRVAEELDDS